MNGVEEYISKQEVSLQTILYKIRQVVLSVHPDITEKISYGMPTFVFRQNIFHFAVQKHHIGLYPTPKPIDYFRNRLTKYKTSKGAIQVRFDQEMPYNLIQEMVEFQVKQIMQGNK